MGSPWGRYRLSPLRLGLHPPAKITCERNKNTALCCQAASPHPSQWPVIFGNPEIIFEYWSAVRAPGHCVMRQGQGSRLFSPHPFLR